MEELKNKEELLNTTMEWLEIYEKIKNDYFIKEIQCQLFINLVEMNIDIFEIRKRYKQILIKLNIYNNNYYAHICILLNLIKQKKDENYYNLSEFKLKSFKYIEESIKEDMLKEITNRRITTDIKASKDCYTWIDFEEGIGEKLTKNKKIELVKRTKKVINCKSLEHVEARNCKNEIKEYIILTYGRWSEEYKKLLEIEGTVKGYPATPRLALLAVKYYTKRDLNELIKIIDK